MISTASIPNRTLFIFFVSWGVYFIIQLLLYILIAIGYEDSVFWHVCGFLIEFHAFTIFGNLDFISISLLNALFWSMFTIILYYSKLKYNNDVII